MFAEKVQDVGAKTGLDVMVLRASRNVTFTLHIPPTQKPAQIPRIG
jgi:hypothetical protein